MLAFQSSLPGGRAKPRLGSLSLTSAYANAEYMVGITRDDSVSLNIVYGVPLDQGMMRTVVRRQPALGRPGGLR